MVREGNRIKRNNILIYAVTLNGDKLLLGVPGKFTLKKDIGAASVMKASFRVNSKLERLISVTAECDGEVIFKGIPDEEIYKRTHRGIYLELVARCNIAMLLDNEVMPQEIKNPTLSFFSRKFLEPYGFYIKSDYKKGYGEIKVKKGASVLGVMNGFFSSVYKTSPVIKENGRVYLLNEYVPNEIYADEKKLIKAEFTRNNYSIVSEYVLPDSVTGAYNVSLKNTYHTGITRKKYREAMDETEFNIYNDVKLTFEGFLKAELYDIIECMDERGMIESILYERDPTGDKTTVLFKSKDTGV
ncbi:MAG: hypothetical protein E7564_03855 [Ruminococcaceae bacterium]|nr:hypothetical protein [Oscillospiraceae bacterium]